MLPVVDLTNIPVRVTYYVIIYIIFYVPVNEIMTIPDPPLPAGVITPDVLKSPPPPPPPVFAAPEVAFPEKVVVPPLLLYHDPLPPPPEPPCEIAGV